MLSVRHLTIAVIGAGFQGRGFALACATAGFDVVLEDVMPAKLRHAEAEFSSLGHSVRLVSTVEDAVRDADLVMDFVPDELESKLEIWSLIDRMAPPKTIMCTLSDALSITDLASCTYRGDRCIMIRGSFQASGSLRMLSASSTSEASRELTQHLFENLGFQIESTPDPDLPQLLKNMNAITL
jgi:3-hydroxybutyryl-CoA dehydrogenase